MPLTVILTYCNLEPGALWGTEIVGFCFVGGDINVICWGGINGLES